MHLLCLHKVHNWSKLNQLAALQWRHNERDGVLNHRLLDCLLNRSSGAKSKKTSKFRATGLCEGKSPVTSEFPERRASNAQNVVWGLTTYRCRLTSIRIPIINTARCNDRLLIIMAIYLIMSTIKCTAKKSFIFMSNKLWNTLIAWTQIIHLYNSSFVRMR